MDMNAFWFFTLTFLLLRFIWKRKSQEQQIAKDERPRVNNITVSEEEKQRRKVDKQKEKDIADLKKQGYSDELIAVILPTIWNDK